VSQVRTRTDPRNRGVDTAKIRQPPRRHTSPDNPSARGFPSGTHEEAGMRSDIRSTVRDANAVVLREHALGRWAPFAGPGRGHQVGAWDNSWPVPGPDALSEVSAPARNPRPPPAGSVFDRGTKPGGGEPHGDDGTAS
jgi:hypothetical protein